MKILEKRAVSAKNAYKGVPWSGLFSSGRIETREFATKWGLVPTQLPT